jgi:hypothetical protein
MHDLGISQERGKSIQRNCSGSDRNARENFSRHGAD